MHRVPEMRPEVPYGLNGDISDEAPTIGSGPAQRELPGPWPTPTAIGADMADGTDLPSRLVSIHTEQITHVLPPLDGDFYPKRIVASHRPHRFKFTLTTEDGKVHEFDTLGGEFTISHHNEDVT